MELHWSPRPRTLKDFPDNTQIRLRQLEPNHVLQIDVVGGGRLFVRRVGINKFQCGIDAETHRAIVEKVEGTVG